ncbi:MAG: bifunctional hydroxymethylpyrimidine kinase/phosphomethylpyrimidine kinase, partial [Nitrospinales bacterium]
MKQVKTALTIAGSDSSGGAGIQADLKTFSALDVFGLSVIASVTSQNTLGVQHTFDLLPEVVNQQLLSVLSDRKPGAVKTGMLGNEAIVECVARNLKRFRVKKIIVDPVIRSSSGKTLLSMKGIRALKEKLLPLALLVTPNLREAEILSGVKISRPSDRRRAARAILKTGVKNVLIKGGHARGNADDFFYDGKEPVILPSDRLTKENLHGTGCVLSAAIVAGLTRGENLVTSVKDAKNFISVSILGGVYSGEGEGCVEPLAGLYKNQEKYDLFQKVCKAIETLERARVGDLIPEVQSNLGVGLRGAKTHEDVIAFPGRIVKKGRDIVTVSPPMYGASRHVANIVLTSMHFDPEKRAVINIKYTDELLRICRKLKFTVGSFNRADEPKRVKKKEGSSLEWGT